LRSEHFHRCFLTAFFLLAAALALPAAQALGAYSVQYYTGNSPSTNSQTTLAPGSGSPTYDVNSIPLVLTSPATVNLGGTIYNFTGGGLYRIYNGATLVRQALVYKGDYWDFGEQLSRIHLHGDRHNADTTAELDTLVRDGTLISLTCGQISPYAVGHLQSLGVQARVVHSLTLDPWNSYDNSHVMIELRDTTENRWVLYDVDDGDTLRFNGHRLNLIDTTQLYRGGRQAQIEILNSDTLYDPQTTYTDPAQNLLMLNHDLPTTQTWYHRVLQVPIINGYFAVNTQAEADRIKQYYPSWTALSPAAFRQMFYAGEPVYVPEPAVIVLLGAGLLAGGLTVAGRRVLRRNRHRGGCWAENAGGGPGVPVAQNVA
jgi:hypothetical protein